MDAAPSAHDLLSHASFVRAVARAVLHDRDEADDVVQDTYLRALERPPAHAGNLRGWLATIARRLALQRRRATVRRTRRHARAARPEALRATDDVAAHLEQQRTVVAAVLALDEPYRSAVFHRYYEGLGVAGIAARLGAPVATVRSRLKRARRMLRARLTTDARSVAGLAVLLGAHATTGAVVMGKQAKWILLVCLLATGALLLQFVPDRGTAVRTAERTPARSAPDAPVPAAAPDTPPPETAPAPPPAPPERARTTAGGAPVVEGRVATPEGKHVAGARIVALARTGNEFHRVTATTDLLGRFVLAELDGDTVDVGYFVGSKWNLVAKLPRGATTLDLPFRGLAGRAFDEKGRPLTYGFVVAHDPGTDKEVARAAIDGQGAFAFYGLDEGVFDLAYQPAKGRSARALDGGRGARGGTVGLTLRVLAGVTIEGLVVDEHGAPKPGVWVRATKGSFLTGATTRSNGRFTIQGIDPGEGYVLQPWLRGYVPHTTDPVRAGTHDVRLRLDPGLRASGRLLDRDGAPLALKKLRLEPLLPLYVTTDADGRFALAGLPDGPVEVWVFVEKNKSVRAGVLRGGDEAVEFRLSE